MSAHLRRASSVSRSSRLTKLRPIFSASAISAIERHLHAFVGEIIVPPIDSPLDQATLCFGNLTDYFNRLQTRLYEFAIRHDRLSEGVPVAVHYIPETGGDFDG